MRLGDLDGVADLINSYKTGSIAKSELLWSLSQQPTIDAGPVKRGTWKLNKDGSGTCDQCHFTQKAVWDFDGWQNFCGVCGADMRERKDGDG